VARPVVLVPDLVSVLVLVEPRTDVSPRVVVREWIELRSRSSIAGSVNQRNLKAPRSAGAVGNAHELIPNFYRCPSFPAGCITRLAALGLAVLPAMAAGLFLLPQRRGQETLRSNRCPSFRPGRYAVFGPDPCA
jgi:hypothetical protein